MHGFDREHETVAQASTRRMVRESMSCVYRRNRREFIGMIIVVVAFLAPIAYTMWRVVGR